MKILFKVASLALALGISKPVIGAELARVGAEVISSEQFGDALKALGNQGLTVAGNPELKKRFLDHIINSRIVAEQAKSSGFEKDPKYQTRLADMTKQLLAGEYMDRKLEEMMTEATIKKYFEDHKTDFGKMEVRASHIVLATEAEAANALKEVSKPGVKFDDVAKSISKDKSVDLGFFARGRMMPELEKAAFSTLKGQIHPKPIKTSFGWHIIKVTDQKGSDQVAFDSVKNEVKTKMRSSLQETMLKSLRDKTKVVLNEVNLKEFKLAQ
ncbi:MAG: peptidyl-prolyl cis-trans isomerase [Proteobacteria bacterium]|nr:peptidyl-prolyl cis-trans isomerase [Pseudomonadota bacterium]